jgi:mono/diheme cytochrome c family protein
MRSEVIRAAGLVGLVALGLDGGRCLAQSATVAQGYRLAAARCATCHVIVANGPGSWTDAPAFETLANRPGLTRQWLTDFILEPHANMLTQEYTRAQADSIAAYILSLRRK